MPCPRRSRRRRVTGDGSASAVWIAEITGGLSPPWIRQNRAGQLPPVVAEARHCHGAARGSRPGRPRCGRSWVAPLRLGHGIERGTATPERQEQGAPALPRRAPRSGDQALRWASSWARAVGFDRPQRQRGPARSRSGLPPGRAVVQRGQGANPPSRRSCGRIRLEGVCGRCRAAASVA